MKTYISQLVYAIKCDGAFTDQYDEQFRLIYADNEVDALRIAKETGIQKSEEIIDRKGRKIFWEMLAVKDVREIQLEQGGLLTSAVIDTTTIVAPLWQQTGSDNF